VKKAFVAGADISEFAIIVKDPNLQQKDKKNYLILSKILKHLLLQLTDLHWVAD
jgi:hypothetical protein